jgi:hypothetical protein
MAPISSPEPTVMPIDREAWRRQLHLSNFVNAYYQFRDVQHWVGETPSILIIGPGQGLDTEIFRWRGCRVTTFDIDDTFRPDVLGSCHEMPMFSDAQFDVVIASHVLEHLPLPFLDQALEEISRVGRYAVFYLPVAGRSSMLRLVPGFKGLDWAAIIDICRFWERPDGLTAKYCGGQHYWEVGYRGFRVRDLTKRFAKFFELKACYRNRDWLPSQNFVLKSANHSCRSASPSQSAPHSTQPGPRTFNE